MCQGYKVKSLHRGVFTEIGGKMDRSKVISFMLVTALLLGATLLRAEDKKKTEQKSAQQAQQQQLKKDIAQHNAQYGNKPLNSAQAAQAQKERQALEARKNKANKQ